MRTHLISTYYTKEKIALLLILFGVMLCVPFSVFEGSLNIIIVFAFLLLISFYLIINSSLSKRKTFNSLVISLSIMLFYSLYYLINEMEYLNSMIGQFVYLFFMLSIYLYFINGIHLVTATRIFKSIILIVSIITIISFIGSNTGTIPFPEQKVGNYDIGFNYLFGGVSIKRNFYRPQYYFAEPSYLGFYLGFCFLYVKQLYLVKKRRIKLLLILIAGISVFSFTFYFAILIGIISEWIYFLLKSFLKPTTISKVYFVSFIVISAIYLTQLDKVNKVFFEKFPTSFNARQGRIEKSIATLQKMNFTEILLGKGTGFMYLDKTRKTMGESNAYMRTLIENGLIILSIYLFVIYFFLKKTPSLLLYTLVALHSVVVLETPFFILIILLASTIENPQQPQELSLPTLSTEEL